MSALDKLLDCTVEKLIEAQAISQKEGPDCEIIKPIIEDVPTMVTLHSFRTSQFFLFVNDQTKDFYGFDENNLSSMNSFFYARTFHPRTFHLLAHTYQYFYRGNENPLHLTYRLKNAEGKYEKVYGSSKGFTYDEKGRLTYILSVTCRERDSAVLNAVVNLGLEGLGGRQKECLFWLLKGHTNAQIGDEMGISARTVEKHVDAIYKEAGVTSRADILKLGS